ncbi:Vacuolar protein sorting-associated protein 62 [Bachmanniomyces sp. S44760]|nr:Vacuolar protein sorting-associated protein 62 [Bachmanniomyces sp. S44760]
MSSPNRYLTPHRLGAHDRPRQPSEKIISRMGGGSPLPLCPQSQVLMKACLADRKVAAIRQQAAACKLFGTCGRTHWRGRWRLGDFVDHDEDDERDEPSFPHDPNDRNKTSPDDWSDDERVIRDIPQFVLEHAPLVHLFSGEGFWPSDIAEHLLHVSPELDYVPIDTPDPNLTNLNDLNRWTKGRHVYLTSNDDPETLPDWITKEENIPEDLEDNYIRAMARADDNDRWEIVAEGKLANDKAIQEGWYEAGDGNSVEESDIADNSQHVSVRPTKVKTVGSRAYTKNPQVVKKGGRSGAPAILVVVDKGDGIVDAFWFFFYSFNLGNVVFNIRFGNHVGDWEHVCVRFQHGIPKAVFFSEHNFGDAYSYEAVQKIGKRPVIYSATGSHAMYAAPGTHSYILPFGLLHDQTDRGPLWDPTLNAHTYTYSPSTDTLRPSNLTPTSPIEWFYFAGQWGDRQYPLDDGRQYEFAGQFHYVSGPLGPRFKRLGRKKVCGGRDDEICNIKDEL